MRQRNLRSILLETAKKYKVDLVVNRFGSMMNPFFTKGKVTNFEKHKRPIPISLRSSFGK